MRYLFLLGIVIAFGFWYFISQTGLINPLFVESPEKVFVTLFNLFVSGDILDDLFATLYRMWLGFIIAASIGIPLGIIMGYSKIIYSLFEPLVDFLRSIPATSLFPLFMLFFGIGDSSKLAVVVFGIGLLILINSMYGVHHTSKARTSFAQSLGASRMLLLRKVVFYEALPHTFVGLRQAISISLILVIVTEMFIGTNAGLGQLIVNSQLSYKIADMYAVIILTGAIGYLTNVGFVKFEKKIIHWAGKT
jgi:NitT/TauT family transport system permease protein